MDWLVAFVLVVFVFVGWGLAVFSLPGNWLIVGSTALYAWLGPASDSRLAIGWWVVGSLVVLAVIGEIVEFAASALGAKKAGASKRSAVLALVGSVFGSLLGGLVGVPIPVLGSLIGAVVGAALGASVGAICGELWIGKELHQTWDIGVAAFVGRLCGTVGKLITSSVMVGVTFVALALR